MLTKLEQDQFEYYASQSLREAQERLQTDESVIAITQGIKLAIDIVKMRPSSVTNTTYSNALHYLLYFSNWKLLSLPRVTKRGLYIASYGEEKVREMEKLGEIVYS